MKTAHVRPLGGRKLRVPERPQQILPETGMKVTLTDYWLARIADGDAEMFDPESDAKPSPAPRRAPRPAPTPPKED